MTENSSFIFDLERMKKACESPSIKVPPEVLESFETFKAWLKNIKDKDFVDDD